MVDKNRLRPFVWVIVCLILLGAGKSKRVSPVDLSKYDFREGDVLLQHLPSKLGSVITDITDSQYSHCGIVMLQEGRLHVLEAIGPVRIVSIGKWIRQGHRRQFTQLRPENLSQDQIADVILEAKKMLGRPYDIQYELDDKKIYCSELVYKAFRRALDIEVGKRQTLGELNWKPHTKFIRVITGGELPLERVMVTPESLVRGQHLKFVYSTFPTRKREPLYNSSMLSGTWRGDYTIRGTIPATAIVHFDRNGKFETGEIRLPDKATIQIGALNYEKFHQQREFVAKLADQRGIEAILKVQIRDNGERIIGTWRDNLGFDGVLSFEKVIERVNPRSKL